MRWVNWTDDVTQQPEGVVGSHTYGRVAVADNEENWFFMVLDWPGLIINWAKNTKVTKALSIAINNQTCRLSESDFTICPSSKGIWPYTLSPGRSISWTERLWSEFCTNPWKSESRFLFCSNGQGPLGRSSSCVYVTLKVLYNITLCYLIGT